MMKHFFFAMILLFVSVNSLAKDTLQVAVVNYPLAYFAERIGGEAVEVLFLVPADEDPAFWQPSAETVSQYQKANLILLNGAGYAKWVEKVSLPTARLVKTGQSYRKQLIRIQGPSHNHGPSGGHSHAGTAFTTWIDFQLAAQQVDAITEAFIKKQKDTADVFTQNAEALKSDLLQLDKKMQDLGQALKGQSFVASHPVYQYMARRYQLQITELMWEPEMKLDEHALAELHAVTRQRPVEWMIWEGTPRAENRQLLAGQGIASLVFSPSGNRPEQGDWLSVMKENIEQLERALK
jgi:zinc transport system substrate-binding protein